MGSPLARRTASVLLGLTTAAPAPGTAAADPVRVLGGTGPYDAEYVTTPRLRDHTVYRPVDLPEGERLPIVAWGNGACRADGTWFENILTEFASHGFLVIASGRPGGSVRSAAGGPSPRSGRSGTRTRFPYRTRAARPRAETACGHGPVHRVFRAVTCPCPAP